MGKIIILDENTANKIAAGEVVERPASVIKELVENSIDAGATSISVEIRNGGISFIRITDNGCGMTEDDVEIAFERHATSKIRRADDLESITSMGFRGEALASIAAVSTVQLVTRVKDSVQGVSITVTGGCVTDVSPVGCPVGTSITVSELFFNTPARYKFLKKDTTEAGYIIDILSRISFSHPEISFTLVNSGKRALQTPGNGDLKSTVFSVYGQETTRQLLEVDYQDENFRIKGYVGKADIARSNRHHQSIFINKRYVRNKTITSAIDKAYSTFLMKNKYPFVLLDIEINPTNVDVNVHPSKMEVKFSNDQDVFRAVYHGINNALLSQSGIRTLPNAGKSDNSYKLTDNHNYQDSRRPSDRAAYKSNNVNPSYSQQEFQWVKRELEKKREAAISGNLVKESQGEVAPECLEMSADSSYSMKNQMDKEPIVAEDLHKVASMEGINEGVVLNEHQEMPDGDKQSVDKKDYHDLFANTRIIGQAFSTYIMLEGEDELYLLDQHAAHERIRYEELKEGYEKNLPFSQMLMSVIHVDLTSSEYQFALSESDLFEKLGFSFESFGANSIILRSAPFIDDGGAVKEGFLEILDFIMSGSNAEKRAVADEALYRMACRSAIKAHKKLDPREIQALLQKLTSLENPYTCPHGRPAILKLRRYELEKLFKRIV